MDHKESDEILNSVPTEDVVEFTPEQLAEKKAYKEAIEKALSELEQLKNNKDVEGLINVLKHAENKYLAKQATWALHELGDEKAIPSLIDEALKGNHGITNREDAVRALGDIGKHNVVESLIYMMGKGSLVRRAAMKALGKIKDNRAVEPLNMVMSDENEEQEFRTDAAEALGEIASKEAIANIIAALDSDIGEKASAILKKVGQPSVEPLIIALGTDIKYKAIIALGQIGEGAKAATQPLLKILETTSIEDDWSGSLRESVLIALALIKDPGAVEPLINVLKYNNSPEHFNYAIQNGIILALGDIGDKLAVELLIQLMLRSIDPRIKGTAAAALGKIGDNQAIKPLISVLENGREIEFVRDNAAWALLQMDEGKTALPLLKYLKWNHKNIFDPLKGFQFPSDFKNEELQE